MSYATRLLFLFGRAEMNANTMTCIALEISKPENKRIVDKIRAEIDGVMKACGGELKNEHVSLLNYTECVIMKTQWMNSVVQGVPSK
jgi:hypothetical protein